MFNSYEFSGVNIDYGRGTSLSVPIVAGIAATIMSEQTEINFTSGLMRKTLINMSIKNIIDELNNNTPNNFINYGKKTVYSPIGIYRRSCGISYHNFKCLKNLCCTKDGDCIDPYNENNDSNLCLINNGCLSEFGYCLNKLNEGNAITNSTINYPINDSDDNVNNTVNDIDIYEEILDDNMNTDEVISDDDMNTDEKNLDDDIINI